MTGDTKDTGIPTPDAAAGTIEEGSESVRRTIVGGRPLDRRRRKVRIPIGIEKVLCAAAADREFREQLLMARADALAGTGLEVSDAEAMILQSVSEDALRVMIENIDLKRHKRRRFFRGIAAASLAATTATISLSCDGGGDGTIASEGCRPDAVSVDNVFVDGDTADDPLTDSEEGTIDARYDMVDAGSTDGPPDIIPYDEHMPDHGAQPDDIVPPDIIDVQDELTDLGATDGTLEDLPPPEDADKVDVDIQPMPAGIPPMEDVKEPK